MKKSRKDVNHYLFKRKNNDNFSYEKWYKSILFVKTKKEKVSIVTFSYKKVMNSYFTL